MSEDNIAGSKRERMLSLILLLIIGVIVRIRADEQIQYLSQCTFDESDTIISVDLLTPSEAVSESDVSGFHFSASVNFAREAAKVIIPYVDNNSPAVGGDTRSVHAYYHPSGARRLNLAEVKVKGETFWIRQVGWYSFKVHPKAYDPQDSALHFEKSGDVVSTRLLENSLTSDAFYGFHFEASDDLARRAAKEFMQYVYNNTLASGGTTISVFAKYPTSVSGNGRNLNLAQCEVNGTIFWLRKFATSSYYIHRQTVDY